MDLYKYRIVKQMKYNDSIDMYGLMDTMCSKMLKFMIENDVTDEDLITFDLRLLLEKNEK